MVRQYLSRASLWIASMLFSTTVLPQSSIQLNDRIVIVQNENSGVSKAIAADYVRRRGVKYIVTVKCPDSALDPLAETISLAQYQKEVERPLRVFLEDHQDVDFVVLTKGIPVRLRGAGEGDGWEWFSLDSRIAAMGYNEVSGAIRVEISEPAYNLYSISHFHRAYTAKAWANRFWNSGHRFSHRKFGGYLVTRLDGYTTADAEALTTRSLQAERSADEVKTPLGQILLDASPKLGFTDKAIQPYSILSEGLTTEGYARITNEKSHLGDVNSDLQLAAEFLRTRGVSVDLDVSETFVGHREGLMGYFSWGSNDPHFSQTIYHSLAFAPGAIAETAVSTSARTFLRTTGGQSLIADLISQGVTGVKGYSDEPLVQAVASPSILFDRYTRGWTLAESFYAASALVGWQDIVVGDPLGRAYPTVDLRIQQEKRRLEIVDPTLPMRGAMEVLRFCAVRLE